MSATTATTIRTPWTTLIVIVMPSFPAPSTLLLRLQLRYLAKGELDRRLPPEDRDQDLQPRLVHVYLGDHTGEVREWSGDDLYRLPDRVINRSLDLLARRLGCLARTQEALDLGPAQRGRLVAGSHDLGNTRGLADEAPGVIVHVHVHQDVARELALDGGHLFAVFDLDDALGRDADVAEVPLEAERVYTPLHCGADLVLVPRVGVNDVPLLQNEILYVNMSAAR